MKRRFLMIVTGALTAAMLLAGSAGVALADNPHAGKSGNFKGSATPCPQAQPCPPHGGKVSLGLVG